MQSVTVALASVSFLSFSVVLSTSSLADDFSTRLGEFEYANSCAQCHGDSAEGDGPIARYLVDPPPPLTSLAKDSGGDLPMDYIVGVLEGTVDIGVHGRDMPLWGVRYRQALSEEMEGILSPEEQAMSALARTLALIDYLQAVQTD